MKKDQDKRPEYYARKACLLNCTPGNLDTADGEPATIITLGGIRDGTVNPLILDIRDSRALVLKMLVALASIDDESAAKVLDDVFPADRDGEFHWRGDFGGQA